MFQTLLDKLSAHPGLWGFLRRVVEDGFDAEKDVIRRNLIPGMIAGSGNFSILAAVPANFRSVFRPSRIPASILPGITSTTQAAVALDATR
jgi:precorrin-4 methylase